MLTASSGMVASAPCAPRAQGRPAACVRASRSAKWHVLQTHRLIEQPDGIKNTRRAEPDASDLWNPHSRHCGLFVGAPRTQHARPRWRWRSEPPAEAPAVVMRRATVGMLVAGPITGRACRRACECRQDCGSRAQGTLSPSHRASMQKHHTGQHEARDMVRCPGPGLACHERSFPGCGGQHAVLLGFDHPACVLSPLSYKCAPPSSLTCQLHVVTTALR